MQQNKRTRILCTRPLSSSLLETAATCGLDVTVQSFTEIHPIITETVWAAVQPLLPQQATVVFTSAHAVESLYNYYLHRPDSYYVPHWDICCLEAGTLQAVQKDMAQCTIKATAANATELAHAIAALPGIQEVYFICGRQRRNELPDILQQRHITVHEIVVYENAATPVKLDTTAYAGALFFSPSAVHSFFSVNTLPATAVCFAIGQTTGKALQEAANNKIIVGERASAFGLLQTTQEYFNNL